MSTLALETRPRRPFAWFRMLLLIGALLTTSLYVSTCSDYQNGGHEGGASGVD